MNIILEQLVYQIKIELIDNNNLLFEGECIYFDTDINDTSSPPNVLIKKDTKYTIKQYKW